MSSYKNQYLLYIVLIVISILIWNVQTQSVNAQFDDGLYVSGTGEFIKNGTKTDSFQIEVNCTADGACHDSKLAFDNANQTISIQGLFAGSTKDYTLFIITSKDQSLYCNVWHFGPITSGPTNDLYFDCLSSQNSAISTNSVVRIP